MGLRAAGRRACRLACVAVLVAAGGCAKNTTIVEPPPAPASVLYAVPPWVAVGTGGIQHVSVSGGVPPYVIAGKPDSIAVAEIAGADSTVAVLKITGITPSSAGTSVVVSDHSPGTPRSVSIPISVF